MLIWPFLSTTLKNYCTINVIVVLISEAPLLHTFLTVYWTKSISVLAWGINERLLVEVLETFKTTKDTELTFTLLRQRIAVFQDNVLQLHGVNWTDYILKSFVCRSTVVGLFNRWASEDPYKQGCKGAGWLDKVLQHQLQKQKKKTTGFVKFTFRIFYLKWQLF